MDNNNLPPQTPATPDTPTPGASPTQAPTTSQIPGLNQTPPVSPNPGAPRSGNKMLLWFVIGLVVVVAVVGGIYFFLSKQQQEPASQPQAITTQTPVPIVEENLEDDLNSINVETDTSSDFAPIDQDMQQL